MGSSPAKPRKRKSAARRNSGPRPGRGFSKPPWMISLPWPNQNSPPCAERRSWTAWPAQPAASQPWNHAPDALPEKHTVSRALSRWSRSARFSSTLDNHEVAGRPPGRLMKNPAFPLGETSKVQGGFSTSGMKTSIMSGIVKKPRRFSTSDPRPCCGAAWPARACPPPGRSHPRSRGLRISSNTSSRVTSPANPPYSSSTMNRCTLDSRKRAKSLS